MKKNEPDRDSSYWNFDNYSNRIRKGQREEAIWGISCFVISCFVAAIILIMASICIEIYK